MESFLLVWFSMGVWARMELMKMVFFWDVKYSHRGSWLWHKLLKLRPMVSMFMKCEVRSGESTYFWFDNWLGTGPLIDKT